MQLCDVLTPECFLQQKEFNIWDCYSEYASDFNNRLHFHDFYELSVIYEGTSDFLVNGNHFSMGERSLQLIRPTDYHRQQTKKGEHIRYYNLMFSADFISEELLCEIEKREGPLCATAQGLDWAELLRLIQTIYQEFAKTPEEPLTQIFIHSSIERICVFLLKHLPAPSPSPIETPQEAVRRALSYIQKNYRSPIRLADAAKAAGLSPSYFSMIFHSTMGTSFSNYLLEYRLQIAARYLRSSDLPMKQIATVCGFSSYSYFISAFKAYFQMPPGSWRTQIQQQPSGSQNL